MLLLEVPAGRLLGACHICHYLPKTLGGRMALAEWHLPVGEMATFCQVHYAWPVKSRSDLNSDKWYT